MAFEGFKKSGNGSVTSSSGKILPGPFNGLREVSATHNSRSDPDDNATVIHWIPLVLLLLGLLPTLAVLFIVGGTLVLR